MEKENIIRHINRKQGVFFVCENQRFSLNFFNWSALNSIKKVDENPGEETQYIKCDHCDNNSNFKNNLRKHSRQNKISLIQTYHLIVIYTKNTMIVSTALLTMISVFHHPSKIYICE